MKFQANKKHQDDSFAVGDWVMLKLQPYRQASVRGQSNSKLGPRFYGPYPLLQQVGKVAYKLQLPPSTRIHNVSTFPF